jgi:hypothetical protein
VFADDFPFKFGEDSHHLKQRFSSGRGGVYGLLVEVEVYIEGMKLAERAYRVL